MIRDDDPYFGNAFRMSSAQKAAEREKWREVGTAVWNAATRAGRNLQARTGAELEALGRAHLQQSAAQPRPQLRGPLPAPPLPQPEDCIDWPLPGRTAINARKPRIQQGDGDFNSQRKQHDGTIKHHQGLDITAPQDTDIQAANSGRVSRVDASKGGYGRRVRIDGADGLSTQYAHLAKAEVRPGDQVQRGSVIGQTGVSGNAADSALQPGGDPHLHFEVRQDGRLVDPYSRLCPPWVGVARPPPWR